MKIERSLLASCDITCHILYVAARYNNVLSVFLHFHLSEVGATPGQGPEAGLAPDHALGRTHLIGDDKLQSPAAPRHRKCPQQPPTHTQTHLRDNAEARIVCVCRSTSGLGAGPPVQPTDQKLGEENKGHQMLMKMGECSSNSLSDCV